MANNGTTLEDIEKAVKPVEYEINMLGFSFKCSTQNNFSSSGDYLDGFLEWESQLYFAAIPKMLQNQNISGIVRNAFIEVFLLHFRTLYDFFYEPKKHNDDILAKHFIITESRLKIFEDNRTLKEELKEYKTRANKQLAHISFDRINKYVGEEKIWPIRDIYSKMEKTIQAFILSLPDDRKRWFKI
ncbi:MAG: hypothetical protein A7316_04610 [Candidatus Altiarchaeales archaeon WOR_SM1_86-2]|nr:MAG: hypothetical protein A7316_04610 [Candidatus Altiarchaeales archaeon WOR_SM1_86-2]